MIAEDGALPEQLAHIDAATARGIERALRAARRWWASGPAVRDRRRWATRAGWFAAGVALGSALTAAWARRR